MTRVRLVYDKNADRLLLATGPLDHDLARQVPGLNYKDGGWYGPATWATALACRGVFGQDLELSPECDAWGWEQVAREQWAAELKAWSPLPDAAPPTWPEGLLSAQVTGVGFLVGSKRAAIFDEPGTGKGVMTATALGLLGLGAFPALIITPRSVKWGHAREIERWSAGVTPIVVTGTPTQRRKQIAQVTEHERGVLVMGWDSVRGHSSLAPYGSVARSASEKEPKELNALPLHTVIVDEAHRAKDPTSKRTRSVWAVTHKASRVWMTTGTPVPDPIGYWSIMHTLVPPETPTRVKFQDRYTLSSKIFVKGGREIEKVTDFNPRTLPELQRIMAPYTLRRTLDEVAPGLPPVRYSTRWCEMEPKQRKAYETMRKEMITGLDTGILVTTGPMQQAGRLLQIASAMPVLDEDGEVIEMAEPSSKITGLLDVLEDRPDEQLVVFASSRKLIELTERVLNKHKITNCSITGPVPELTRRANEEAFQAGEHRVILCTYGAGSEGITLTAAHTQVMMQRSFQLLHNVQADGRCRRIGQTAHHVEVIDLVSVNSYDESVYQAGAYKEATAQALLNDPGWVRRTLEER